VPTTPPPSLVEALLRDAGLPGPFTISSMPGGANNRVHRVEVAGRRVLLKAYFQHPRDPRDRLGAEWAFCSFAWQRGVRGLPQPLACDRANRLGLYELVDGEPLAAGQVGVAEVRQAVDLFREINRHRRVPEALTLPAASEAAFSLGQHVACVDGRVARLRQVDESGPAGREAGHWVRDELLPSWERVRAGLLAGAAAAKLDLSTEIQLEHRCLSPSDFGFHNALRTPGGALRFVDFEYAGWDDPAKTVCDFFCQPAVPAPREHFDLVAEGLTDGLGGDSVRRRIPLLWPVYRVKWCCILLNELLPAGRNRRSFARRGEPQERRRFEQLRKAREALADIER
jgi:hypothetical protein